MKARSKVGQALMNSNVRRWGAKPRGSVFPQLSLPSSGNMLVTGTIATCGLGQTPHHSSLPSAVVFQSQGEWEIQNTKAVTPVCSLKLQSDFKSSLKFKSHSVFKPSQHCSLTRCHPFWASEFVSASALGGSALILVFLCVLRYFG